MTVLKIHTPFRKRTWSRLAGVHAEHPKTVTVILVVLTLLAILSRVSVYVGKLDMKALMVPIIGFSCLALLIGAIVLWATWEFNKQTASKNKGGIRA